MRKYIRAKIHQARVTHMDPEYEGSISIDAELLEASGIDPYEHVLIADIETGVRFETYVLVAERGSGIIGVNGAAANMNIQIDDRLIIMSFTYSDERERLYDYTVGMKEKLYNPKVIICNDDNKIIEQEKTKTPEDTKAPEDKGQENKSSKNKFTIVAAHYSVSHELENLINDDYLQIRFKDVRMVVPGVLMDVVAEFTERRQKASTLVVGDE